MSLLNWKEIGIWVVIGLWFLSVSLPASLWYKTGQLHIPDYTQGTNPSIVYNGGPVRNFKGSYGAVVRSAKTGEIVAETPQSSIFSYKPNAARPDLLKLDWWVNSHEKTMNLPPGSYTMETCWTIRPPLFFLMNKYTCAESNIFTVAPNEGIQ